MAKRLGPPDGYVFTDPAYERAGWVPTPHWHAWESNYGALTDRAYATEQGAAIAAGRWAAQYRRDPDFVAKHEHGDWVFYDAKTGEELFDVGPLMCETDDDCHMIEEMPDPS